MSIFRRFFVGAGYSTLTAVVNRIMLAVGSIVFARFLGAADFGVYVNLIALVNLCSVVCLFGVNTAFSSFIPQYNQTQPEKLPAVIVSGLLLNVLFLGVFSSILLPLANTISVELYRGQVQALYVMMALPWLMGVTMNASTFAALYGFQDFRHYAAVNLLSGAVVATLTIAGAFLFGLRGIIIGNGIAYGVSVLLALSGLGRYGLTRMKGWSIHIGASLKEVFRFSLPTFLSGLFVAPAFWVGNFLLVQHGAVASSGYFGVANSLAQLVLFIPATMSAPLVPIFSEVSSTENPERFSELVVKNVRMIWSVALPIAAFMGAAAFWLIVLLYGRQYVPSVSTFVVLVVTNLLIAVESILGYVLIAKKKMWDSFVANFLWFCLFLAFAWFMIRDFDQLGFAMALLASYLLYGVVIVVVLKRHITFSLGTPDFVRAVGFSGLVVGGMVAVVLFVESMIPAIALAVLLTSVVVAAEWNFFLSIEERRMLLDLYQQYRVKYLGN